MIIEKNNFIVETKEKIRNLDDIIDFINKRTENIVNFFSLNQSIDKIKIKFYNSLEEYKKHIEKYTDYHDYMCADTFDGNINTLTLEEAHKTKEHKNMTLDELKRNITHEYVHICHGKVLEEEEKPEDGWYWEVLATNLGNKESFETTDFSITKEQLMDFNNLDNNYRIVYTIGRYMFETYSKEELVDFAKHPSIVNSKIDNILEGTIDWLKNNK